MKLFFSIKGLNFDGVGDASMPRDAPLMEGGSASLQVATSSTPARLASGVRFGSAFRHADGLEMEFRYREHCAECKRSESRPSSLCPIMHYDLAPHSDAEAPIAAVEKGEDSGRYDPESREEP